MMIHELTHASQVRRLEIEKGTRWAAEYWSINAKKQLNNTIFKGGDPYGKKGDNNWQQTALSEGWGYFMEWTMARDILKWNSFDDKPWTNQTPNSPDKDADFPYKYAAMFHSLSLIGCSYFYLEKSLGTYNFNEFKNNLIRLYPGLNNQISQIVDQYESFIFN